MKKNQVFGDDQIPCKGRVIIRFLDYSRGLLTSLRFKEKVQQDAAVEQAKAIEIAIVEIATLCSGATHWDQLYSYLKEVGIDVSQEFCLRKVYLDQLMDDSPVESNRN